MTDVNAAEGAVKETELAAEPQVTQPSSSPAEVASAGNDTSENVVTSESDSVAPEKDLAWYEEQNKQLKAEAARKRDKLNKEREARKAAEARLEQLNASAPKQEQFDGDFDAYQQAQNEHMLRRVMAEEKLTGLSGEGVRNDDLERVQKASEGYVNAIQGYFGQEGAVNPQAYQSKEAVFNDFLTMRTPSEQAMIIEQLATMENAPEVIMNIADNPEALNKLANEPVLMVGSVLSNAKRPSRPSSAAPQPVPEVNGAKGAISGDYDMNTIEGVMQWERDNGIRKN